MYKEERKSAQHGTDTQCPIAYEVNVAYKQNRTLCSKTIAMQSNYAVVCSVLIPLS